MKELMLWRHAKSSWADPGLGDSVRPLNPRGRRAADCVARWLAARHLRPDLICCSPAVRTRQTLDYLLAEPALAAPVQFDDALYLASAETLLARTSAVPATANRALLVGHNDGMWHLARALAAVGPLDQLACLREKYPTGALAWLRLPIERWSEIAGAIGHGEIVHFVRPRDIADEAR